MSDNLPTILEAVDAEMGVIEQTMRTDRAAYNRGGDARYLALATRRQQLTAPDTPATIDGEDPMKLPSLAEFREMAPAGDYGAFVRGMRDVGDIYLSVPAVERKGFVESFEKLSDETVGAMMAVFWDRSTVVAEPLSQDTVAHLRNQPAIAQLLREWGDSGINKLAVARTRCQRILDSLEDEAGDEFVSWLAGLSTASAVAVYRKLVG